MSRRLPLRIAAALALGLAAAPAMALTFFDADHVCPIGGEKFKQPMVGSGTQFGVHLDLKPFGPTAAPWPLPVCPGNGFVMYREDFDKAQLDKLAAFIATPAYREAVREDTPYFRAVLLMREVGETPDVIAFNLLKASWETDAQPARYARYAAATLDALRASQAAGAGNAEQRLTFDVLIGELLRRLGRFEEADAHFAALQAAPTALPKTLARVVRQQRALIAARDATAQRMADEKDDIPPPPDGDGKPATTPAPPAPPAPPALPATAKP